MAESAPVKLHRPVALVIVDTLSRIFDDGAMADRAIEQALKSHRRFGSRDRKLLAESVFEIVRHRRFLEAAAGQSSHWLVLGAWLCLSDAPQADVKRSSGFKKTNVREIRDAREMRNIRMDISAPLVHGALPDWPEFSGLDLKLIQERARVASQDPATRESVPDWLFTLGRNELGKTWEHHLHTLNAPAPVILRANRLRVSREKLALLLEKEGIHAVPVEGDLPDALRLSERRNVFLSDAFKRGYFEIQDGASQQIAPMLDAQPGENVIDACAGAGGKSLHLAALMKNKGKIIALDVSEGRLEELRRRAVRAGADIIETRTVNSAEEIKGFEGGADRVLLDVPCSGLGVLRRNPDAKWKLSERRIHELRTLQAEILRSYSELLKPGGRLVYSTCSILPSENERQVEEFVKASGGRFTLIEERNFAPGENGFDGFYSAALEKK